MMTDFAPLRLRKHPCFVSRRGNDLFFPGTPFLVIVQVRSNARELGRGAHVVGNRERRCYLDRGSYGTSRRLEDRDKHVSSLLYILFTKMNDNIVQISFSTI